MLLDAKLIMRDGLARISPDCDLDKNGYRYLDAAQLIKHGFGVAWTAKLPAALIYVYWEPDDARRYSMFAEHRAEIAAFSQRVAGGRPSFASISYPELWSHWESTGDKALRAHVATLRARYGGELGSYEGLSAG